MYRCTYHREKAVGRKDACGPENTSTWFTANGTKVTAERVSYPLSPFIEIRQGKQDARVLVLSAQGENSPRISEGKALIDAWAWTFLERLLDAREYTGCSPMTNLLLLSNLHGQTPRATIYRKSKSCFEPHIVIVLKLDPAQRPCRSYPGTGTLCHFRIVPHIIAAKSSR